MKRNLGSQIARIAVVEPDGLARAAGLSPLPLMGVNQTTSGPGEEPRYHNPDRSKRGDSSLTGCGRVNESISLESLGHPCLFDEALP
jgi:hypothetical protein